MGTYRENKDEEYLLKLQELEAKLPDYLHQFFIGKDSTTEVRTRLEYARDLQTFLIWLKGNRTELENTEIKNIPLEIFDELKADDIEEYLAYLTMYELDGIVYKNGLAAKQRKLAAIRSFYKYFNKKERLIRNPAALVDNPKTKDKGIVSLNSNEEARFMSTVTNGVSTSNHGKKYHAKVEERDRMIYTLLLRTGIRVSELVGINVSDIDMAGKTIRIVRKGNKEDIIYIDDETRDMLSEYIDCYRPQFLEKTSDEPALFLSMKKKRLSVRQVEHMTKTYAIEAVPSKKITPHKMRSTFGTNVYQKNKDIRLTADLLGHSSTEVTAKRYASKSEEMMRKAIDTLYDNK